MGKATRVGADGACWPSVVRHSFVHFVGYVELPKWLLFGELEVVRDVFSVHRVNMWLVGGEPGIDGHEELCCLCYGFFFCEAHVGGGIDEM